MCTNPTNSTAPTGHEKLIFYVLSFYSNNNIKQIRLKSQCYRTELLFGQRMQLSPSSCQTFHVWKGVRPHSGSRGPTLVGCKNPMAQPPPCLLSAARSPPCSSVKQRWEKMSTCGAISEYLTLNLCLSKTSFWCIKIKPHSSLVLNMLNFICAQWSPLF